MSLTLRKCTIFDTMTLLDYIIAFIMVIAPVFQHYYAPFVNAGWMLWLVGIFLIITNLCLKKTIIVQCEYNTTVTFLVLIIYNLYHII